jgi:hypothetical protein
LVAIIAARAIARVREGEPLAWLLLVGTASLVCVGIMEQPTEQGFMVINVAFSLAALKLTGSPVESMPIADPRWLQAHNDLNA